MTGKAALAGLEDGYVNSRGLLVPSHRQREDIIRRLARRPSRGNPLDVPTPMPNVRVIPAASSICGQQESQP